jgi:hypothetical protein
MNLTKKLPALCAIFILAFSAYAQKIEVPVQWKVGDIWTYDLKQKYSAGNNLGDKNTRMSFQLKVLAVNPQGKPGYELEWKYLSYNTFETDTLEDECELIYKRFILQTPLKLRVDASVKYLGWSDVAGIQKKFMDFYAKETKKTGNTTCFDNTKSTIELVGGFNEYFEARAPEIQHFFLGFAMLPAETNYKKDTLEVFKDFLADFNKTIRLPKKISQTASTTFANTVEVNYQSTVSAADYKQYFAESSRIAWDKLGIEKGGEMRKSLEEQLAAFEPKIGDTLRGVFDKRNGSIIKFEYIKEAQANLKGGESTYYYYTKR